MAKRKRRRKSGLLDLEAFTAHVEAATRQAGYEVVKHEPGVLHVVVHDEPMRCKLDISYQAYLNSPHRLDDVVEAHLEALGSVPPPSPPLTEKRAAEALLPMLNRADLLEQAQRHEATPLAHRPFVAGLIITYVFDFPDYRAYVNEDMLAKMMAEPETTFDMIHEYALHNLRLRTTSDVYHTHGLRDQTMVVCDTRDGYAATHVLLPDLMDTWAGRIPGHMLIGVPNRDFLIAFSDRDPAHVAAIAGQVRRDAAERDHPLRAELLLWKDGRIREYRFKG
jgi:uncharacterized protein YtpQ (UPF0354 family)